MMTDTSNKLRSQLRLGSRLPPLHGNQSTPAPQARSPPVAPSRPAALPFHLLKRARAFSVSSSATFSVSMAMSMVAMPSGAPAASAAMCAHTRSFSVM